jgi:hypothetical protein
MDAALTQLLILRLRGGLRQRVLQLASVRGLVFTLAFGGIIWFLIVANSSSATGLFGSAALDRQAFGEQILTFMPLSMLGLSLLTVAMTTGPTFHFSPNEINFLFTGPFRRQDLIVYKFAAYVAGVTLSSVFVTLLVQPEAGSILPVFIATLLTLVFVQLNSAVISMAGHALDGSRVARLKWPALALLGAIGVAALLYAWATPDLGIVDLLSEFRHSWIGTVILIPYIVFAELFVATSLSDMALWAFVAVVINAALLRAAILLDARTTDRALARTPGSATDGNASNKVDRSGRRNGPRCARSVVRQVLAAWGPLPCGRPSTRCEIRSRLIIVFGGLAASIAPISAALGAPVTEAQTMMIIYIFIAFILPRNLVCDFRGDLSRMEIYKTLPIAPWRICAGQLVVQTLLAYGVTLVIIASALVFEARGHNTSCTDIGGFCASVDVSCLCRREHGASSVPDKARCDGTGRFRISWSLNRRVHCENGLRFRCRRGIDCSGVGHVQNDGAHVGAAWIGQLAHTDVDRTSDIGRQTSRIDW